MQREAQETKTCQGRGGAKRKAHSREQHDQNMEVMMKEETGEESHRAAKWPPGVTSRQDLLFKNKWKPWSGSWSETCKLFRQRSLPRRTAVEMRAGKTIPHSRERPEYVYYILWVCYLVAGKLWVLGEGRNYTSSGSMEPKGDYWQRPSLRTVRSLTPEAQ